MSERLTTYCDAPGCKNALTEANHWHKAITFAKDGCPEAAIIVGDISVAGVDGPNPVVLDFCSHQCIIKYTSRIIGKE